MCVAIFTGFWMLKVRFPEKVSKSGNKQIKTAAKEGYQNQHETDFGASRNPHGRNDAQSKASTRSFIALDHTKPLFTFFHSYVLHARGQL